MAGPGEVGRGHTRAGSGHAGRTGSPAQAQGTLLASRGRAVSEAPVPPGHECGHLGRDP